MFCAAGLLFFNCSSSLRASTLPSADASLVSQAFIRIEAGLLSLGSVEVVVWVQNGCRWPRVERIGRRWLPGHREAALVKCGVRPIQSHRRGEMREASRRQRCCDKGVQPSRLRQWVETGCPAVSVLWAAAPPSEACVASVAPPASAQRTLSGPGARLARMAARAAATFSRHSSSFKGTAGQERLLHRRGPAACPVRRRGEALPQSPRYSPRGPRTRPRRARPTRDPRLPRTSWGLALSVEKYGGWARSGSCAFAG